MHKNKRLISLLSFVLIMSILSGCAASVSNEDVKEVVSLDKEADYVVVGGGAAGLMTALELSTKGKVILLEKMPALGGTTIRSKGYLWSVDSSINKSTGKGLTGEELLNYYKEKAGATNFNEPLFQKMIDVSGEAVDSLIDKGMPFNKEKLVPGTPNYPELLCLTVDGEGPALVAKFKELLEENNVEILMNTAAMDLIVKDGEVKGVVAEKDGKTFNILSQRTILATGGFVRSSELMEEYNKEFVDNIPFTGVGSTGDGIVMAKKADAQLVGDGVLGIWGMNEDYGYVGDIGSLVRQTAFYINKDGNRFVNEKRYYAEVHKELNKIQDKLSYGLFDSSNPDLVANLEKANIENLSIKADSIEELAEKLNVDVENLKATVDQYNEDYKEGKNGEFGISNAVMTPILKAPFYAVDVRPTIIGTIKGLKVNENTEVLNTKNEPIPNLYATGELIIGNFINNEYPSTGSVVATAIYSGKIAADSASQGITRKYNSDVVKTDDAKDNVSLEKSDTKYKDGVYSGESKGMNDMIRVEVTVKDSVVSEVRILSHSETAGISDPALKDIPQRIVQTNSPDVDVVSGATKTSNGIMEAVKIALESAK
ncbi:MAG TPA: hypothetical protein DC038_08860 [Clostridiales bacterium]|nr:hypothetical protein [Clostridiales bacterium]